MASQSDFPEDTARHAGKIIQNPSHYKICEGCDSIVRMKAHTCPECGGYRFEESSAAVVRQARVLGARAAVSAGGGE